jgi:hypothetical protein
MMITGIRSVLPTAQARPAYETNKPESEVKGIALIADNFYLSATAERKMGD